MRVMQSVGVLLIAAVAWGCGSSDGDAKPVGSGGTAGSGIGGDGGGDSGGGVTQPGRGPGRLSLAQMEGMGTRNFSPGLRPQDGSDAGPTNEGDTSAPVAFDLGELRGSRDFFFILRNPGGAAVTDVTITSSEPSFPVAPESISVVEPDAAASIVPVIRATAVHGTTLGGVGWQPVLSPGSHHWTLSLQGKTSDPDTGEVIPVRATAELSVHALVFDIEAYDGTNPIDLSHASFMTGDDPGYDIQASFPTIKNVGNVPIKVRSLANPPTMPYLKEVALQPGESTTESDLASSSPSSTNNRFHLEIDGANTVADADRLPVKPDGRIRIVFYHWDG